MLEAFKKLALRGNAVDLAVGVIIGAAFGAIGTSAVQDLFAPLIGAITGGIDFSNYYFPLSSEVQAGLTLTDAKKQGAVLGHGRPLTIALDFVIVAFTLFLMIPGMNRLNRTEKKPAPKLSQAMQMLVEIRNFLTATPRGGV